MEKENNNFPPVSFDEFPVLPYTTWKEEAVKLLKGGDFDKKLLTKTFEGIVLKPIYTREDIDNINEFPGAALFRRGVNEDGYIEKGWKTAQEILADTPEEVNSLIKDELNSGSNAFNLKLSPESMGIANETGAGTHVFTLEQLKTALKDINLGQAGIYLDTGFSSYPLVYLLAATKRCFKNAHGIAGGSPLSNFAKYGKLPRPIDTLYDEMATACAFVSENSPNTRTVLVDAKVFADAGCDSVTELACVMSQVSEYMNALINRGISPDLAARSIGISLSLGSNYFMEIAKVRAARVLFSQITKDFGASHEASCAHIHAITSEFNKTLFDPYVNVLRLTTEAFSGIIGGVDALTVLPFDGTAGRSDAHSRRISRNISIMMGEEFGLKSPIDPAGGSWYVESLTNEFINAVWEKFTEYEDNGGFYEVLIKGLVQESILKTCNDKKSKLNTRALRAVGTNMYANPSEKPLVREDKANTIKINVEADNNTNLDIDGLMDDFTAGGNTLSVYNKINNDCKIVCQRLNSKRLTEDYESMRLKTMELGGINVLLLNMGPVSQHKARADFSTGFFEVGGFNVVNNMMFETTDCAINAGLNENPDVCVICSTDDTYPELVPAIAKGIKEKNTNIQIILAGAPASEHKDSYLAAGVDDFIHLRSNCLEILEKILEERGNQNV